MDGLRVAKHEWRAIFHNKKVIISVVAVLLVPLLYSYLYLWAFWDPYARLNDLPVAVVNQDAGAEMDGKSVNIGKELVDKLAAEPKLKWDFTSYENAKDGLESGRYYMMVQIPADFSKKAATASQEKPEQAEIIYVPNESRNLLASQVGQRAMQELRAEIQKQMTEKYAEVLFDKLGETGKGLADAAAGAKQLTDGLLTVKQGTVRLQDGAGQLAAGARKLGDGARQLESGLKNLQSGLQKASDGSSQVAAGLDQLYTKGQELSQSANRLTAGLQQTNQAIGGIAPAMGETSAALQQLAPVATDTLEQWKALAAKYPELLQDPNGQKLAQELAAVSGNLPKTAEASRRISELLNNSVAPGLNQLATGSGQLASGVEKYVASIGQAQAGAQQVADGNKQLYEGAGKLADGAASLAAGSGSLAAGGTNMQNGAGQLANGVGKLTDGSQQLSSKLSNGSQEIDDGLVGKQDKARMIADPVELQESKLHPVANYGTGMSPYFISLALYVGAMLLFIILDVRQAAVVPKRGTAWLFGKFAVYAPLAILQALIVAVSLRFGLGLQVMNQPLFYGMCMLASLTFVILIQGLNSILGEPGRLLAIVILMLQLTSSAGTYPLEMTSDFFQAIHPYLPMTYTVDGLRAAIAGGDTGRILSNMRVLAEFIAGIAAVTALLSLRRHPGAKAKNGNTMQSVTA